MTRSEIAKQRRQFILNAQEKLLRISSAAEKALLDEILNKLFDELGANEGKILSDSGKSLKLSQAIEQVFDHFNKNKNVDIVREIAAAVQQLTTLNQQYFATVSKGREDRYKKVFADVEKRMKNRIGLSAEGKIVRGGYLYRLLNDTTLRNKVQDAMRQASVGNTDVKTALQEVRKIVVGDETVAGGLTHHYRTFAFDTFSKYDSAIGNGIATGLGLQAAIYEGGLIETSREFCKKKSGKVFTRAEIENFKNDPDLLTTKAERKSGRLEYNPFEDKGRWNCRHIYNWIDKDLAIKIRPDLKALYAEQE